MSDEEIELRELGDDFENVCLEDEELLLAPTPPPIVMDMDSPESPPTHQMFDWAAERDAAFAHVDSLNLPDYEDSVETPAPTPLMDLVLMPPPVIPPSLPELDPSKPRPKNVWPQAKKDETRRQFNALQQRLMAMSGTYDPPPSPHQVPRNFVRNRSPFPSTSKVIRKPPPRHHPRDNPVAPTRKMRKSDIYRTYTESGDFVDVCYKCDIPGHIHSDPKCPKWAPPVHSPADDYVPLLDIYFPNPGPCWTCGKPWLPFGHDGCGRRPRSPRDDGPPLFYAN
jgi:hypothetical protein